MKSEKENEKVNLRIMGSVLLIIFGVTETVLALASDFVGYSGLFPPKS